MTHRRLAHAPGSWRLRPIQAAGFMVVLMGTGVWAQPVSEAMVKAAFLYNFVKFAAWPAEALPPQQPLTLCVIGETGVADALSKTIEGQTIEGRDLAVRVVTPHGPFETCHLLYAARLNDHQSVLLFDRLKQAPVFTVGDSERFAALGGMAQLIVEQNRMRIAINVAACQRSRISISSRLLSLATIVKDEVHVTP